MNVKASGVILVAGLLSLCISSAVRAQDFAGNSYAVLGIDVTDMSVEQFNWTFAGNGSDTEAEGDNETGDGADNETGGTIVIEQPGTTFESSSGSYIAQGNFFNGKWEATEKTYSNYYEEDIYTYYTFLFVGALVGNDLYMAGTIYSTITVTSETTGTEKHAGIIPFVGMLVSRDAGQTAGSNGG